MKGHVWIALILSLGLHGCAEPQPDPVASVAVSLNHSEAPLGSPLEMSYRFTVFQTAPAFDQDYRVLVHFVDIDGELMWTDDHEPPVPTTRWRAGQTITYSRTIFLPLYPYLGKAVIRVGLYAPDGTARVPMLGEDDGQRAYTVETVHLLPQSDNVFLIFQDGWYPAEVSREDPMVEWRWTRQDATLTFRNPRREAMLYLRTDGRPDLVGAPQHVAVSVGETVIGTFAIETEEATLHKLPVAANQFGSSDMVELALHVDQTFVPAERSGGQGPDARELGIRVFNVFVDAR